MAVADALAAGSAGGSFIGSGVSGTVVLGGQRGEGSGGRARASLDSTPTGSAGRVRASLDSTPLSSNTGSLVGGTGILTASLIRRNSVDNH